MSTDAIVTEELSRSFGSVRAVEQLSLVVPRGIVFGFLGPNGSGKTTTIHLLLGLLDPDRGSARVLGYDARREGSKVRAASGALLEFHGLYERLSAEDNLEFFARIHGMKRADRRERIRSLLGAMGLLDRRTEPVRQWSRGMKQKLAVARALVHRPALVFLDEPTAGFDPVAAAALRDELAELVAREGTTIFLNTHNLTEAERLCALVGVIRGGRLVATGSPAELRALSGGNTATLRGRGLDPRMASRVGSIPGVLEAVAEVGGLRLTLDPHASLAPVVRAVVEAGGEVEDARRDSATLEEVFLTLVREEGTA